MTVSPVPGSPDAVPPTTPGETAPAVAEPLDSPVESAVELPVAAIPPVPTDPPSALEPQSDPEPVAVEVPVAPSGSNVEPSSPPEPIPPPAEPPAPAAESSASDDIRSGGVRSFVEGLVCLALAVLLFRTFHLEGYMISTGSMAPSLYGYHKRVVCPSCDYVFAHGVAYDASVPAAKGDDFLGTEQRTTCSCPNCGQYGIDVTDVPRNQGDQLLVHKHAYVFQSPRRWEVVVFRNPNDSGEAYVKRIVGLPGERIRVRGGDLYVNGKVERKDLYAQRAIRIPVFDQDYEPTDARWRPRWVHDDGWTSVAPDVHHNGFTFRPDADGDAADSGWLTYRHWVRSGGIQETSVQLKGWPLDADLPDPSLFATAVRFDAETNRLSCIGTLSASWRSRLLAISRDEEYREAIAELHERSHIAPIDDFYGYNRSVAGVQPRPVRDLMFTATLDRAEAGSGRFVVRMTDGVHDFDWIVDYSEGMTRLVVDGVVERPVREAAIPRSMLGERVEIEMSTFDRHVVVTAGGKPVLEPWLLSTDPADNPDEPKPIRRPVRVRASGGEFTFSHLVLYRDVHYTRGRAVNGVDEPYQLREDEYFALGDNSPVSFDSRSWPTPAVPERLLLGKPLVVHLPSKPGRIRVFNREAHIRIPDFSRIRYVR